MAAGLIAVTCAELRESSVSVWMIMTIVCASGIVLSSVVVILVDCAVGILSVDFFGTCRFCILFYRYLCQSSCCLLSVLRWWCFGGYGAVGDPSL